MVRNCFFKNNLEAIFHVKFIDLFLLALRLILIQFSSVMQSCSLQWHIQSTKYLAHEISYLEWKASLFIRANRPEALRLFQLQVLTRIWSPWLFSLFLWGLCKLGTFKSQTWHYSFEPGPGNLHVQEFRIPLHQCMRVPCTFLIVGPQQNSEWPCFFMLCKRLTKDCFMKLKWGFYFFFSWKF